MSSSSTRVAFVTALVFGAVPCVSAQDDPAAVDRLLQRAETAARALPGFRCEASRSNISVTRTATDVSQVAFLRPNFFRVVQKEGGGQRTYTGYGLGLGYRLMGFGSSFRPLPLPPAPCVVETHGPYLGGSGWPAANSGQGTTPTPFDPQVPPALPTPTLTELSGVVSCLTSSVTWARAWPMAASTAMARMV
jgi:hypothetical protein